MYAGLFSRLVCQRVRAQLRWFERNKDVVFSPRLSLGPEGESL